MNYDEELDLPLEVKLKHLFDFKADIEARVKQLENYIGDIKQLKFYANSLQETLDRYVSPLYIEKTDNEGNSLYIDSYLGRPNEIPPYSMIKVRASHTLTAPQNNPGTKIIFKRGDEVAEYPLMKMKENDNVFEELQTKDFINGNVYEIYFNAQNIAIISSSNAGVTALNIAQDLNETVTAIQNTLKAMGIDGNNLTVPGKLIANDIEAVNAKVTTTMDLTSVTDMALPQGTTIQDPTTDLGVANRSYVDKKVAAYTADYFGKKHIVGTGEAAQVMETAENDSFYFKIGG